MAAQKTRRAPEAVEREFITAEERGFAAGDPAVRDAIKGWERYALRFLRSPRHMRPLAMGVTSAVRGEGRTTGSVALAIALAKETRAAVALVGIDRQGYGLAEAFELKEAPDLDGVMRGTWTLEAAMSATGLPGLSVLPARSSRDRLPVPPARFWPHLRRTLPDLLAELKRDFAYVVCDLPPLLDNAEAPDIANEMDAIVLLTRSGVTPLRKLEEGLSYLDEARLAGAIHIGAEAKLPKWLTALLME